MPLTDRDPNGLHSGRASRASNLSVMSRPGNKPPGQDALASSVQSMLRTSTEMGDVAGLTGGMSDFANVPRAPQRRGASSRQSGTSTISTRSTRTNKHHRNGHSSFSGASRQSMPREYMQHGPQYLPDTLSPTAMNIPGSSPLVPLQHPNRDSNRAHSMTNTTTNMQPPHRLNPNRSMGSLQGHGNYPRSSSPLRQHSQMRFRGQRPRPASPAWSDAPGSQSSRLYFQGHRGQPHHTGQTRQRMPSDTSLGYHDVPQDMPRRPSQAPSPAYYQGLQGDVPPLPALNQHYQPAVEQQARLMNRSIKGSMSSGSTNMRTDSDTPSSDMPQPPTPKDYFNTPMRGTSHGSGFMRRAPKRMLREEPPSVPDYYDYSEPFERDDYNEPDAQPIPTGFIERGKAAMEGTVLNELPTRGGPVQGRHTASNAIVKVPSLPELPASPVARRVTRDMVLKVLEPPSTTGDLSTTRTMNANKQTDGAAQYRDHTPATTTTTENKRGKTPPSSPPAPHRQSLLSQPASSLLESSTVDFAVRYSIPAMTGNGVSPDPSCEVESSLGSPGSTGRSTEDGMSELLAGYQHTDSRQEDDSVPGESINDRKPSDERSLGRRSNHAQKSSDEQSFKSCTDVPELTSPATDQHELRNAVQLSTVSTTADDTSSNKAKSGSAKLPPQEDAILIPAPGSPVSKAADKVIGPGPVLAPITSPKRAVLRKPLPSRVTNVSNPDVESRSGSKPSMKLGTVSTSGSSSTLGVSQPGPSAPPRESSASKEAQRANAISNFLLRTLVPSRLRKGKKQSRAKEDVKSNKVEHDGSESMLSRKNGRLSESSSQIMETHPRTPTKALLHNNGAVIRRETSPVPNKDNNVPRVNGPNDRADAPEQNHHVLASRAEISAPSSIYSPPGTGSAFTDDRMSDLRPSNSPPSKSSSRDQGRRDSQTTTHLSWHGRRSMQMFHASASEPHLPLPSVQEDSTTDLRLSAFRYNPRHNLPDLKEESHEDSSLNTSASNLKHSHFRFPHAGGPSVRASVDDAVVFSQRSSLRSQKRSDVVQRQGLPSLEISQGDLLAQLGNALGFRLSRSLDDLKTEVSGDAGDAERRALLVQKALEATADNGEDGQIQRAEGGDATTRRVLSPEIVAEIDRLTIPSVNGLTQRISEMMPTESLKEVLRGYQKPSELDGIDEFPEENKIMETAMENLKEVHTPSQKRSSARLRALPGHSKMVMVDDDVYENIVLNSSEKRNDHGGVGPSSRAGEARSQAQNNHNIAPVTVPNTPSRIELQPPSPAVLRPRSNTVAGNQVQRVSAESTWSSRRSLRSFGSTPTATDTRPWNSDKNYPWATSSLPSVDISLPLPAAVRNSPRPGPSHLRNRLSDTSTTTLDSTHAAFASPFGITTDSQAHSNAHRHSLFGGRGGDQPHAVGERYPTSALSPPTAIFRDHLSNCYISDDEDFTATRNKTKLSLRKRISSTTRNNNRATPRVSRSKVNPAELASPATEQEHSTTTLQNGTAEARAFTSNRHTFRDAQGMTPVAYHRHRIVDSIKRWWHKGGDFVKSITRRNNGYSKQA